MSPGQFSQEGRRFAVTRVRVGRVALVLGLGAAVLLGGTFWLLRTQGTPIASAITESTAWPAWLKQAPAYPVAEAKPPPPPPPAPVDHTAEALAAMRAELERQRQELEALKKRPSGTTVIQPQQAKSAPTTPPVKPYTPMLFVSHDVKDVPHSDKPEYLLAPGATKIPCIVETAINSDVPGYLTNGVSLSQTR